jgi:hypothetical protein
LERSRIFDCAGDLYIEETDLPAPSPSDVGFSFIMVGMYTPVCGMGLCIPSDNFASILEATTFPCRLFLVPNVLNSL